METKRQEIAVNDSVGNDLLTALPPELTKSIFEYLSAVDLSHVASCNRHLRNVANTDSLWRPLCLRNGWERYDSITDLVPYKPQDVSGGWNDVSFNMAAIVKQDSTTDLVATCRWKEIYMKSNHLENNWKNKRFHVSNLKPRDLDAKLDSDRSGRVHQVAIDKDCLVVSMSNETIQIWDVKTETCRHVTPAISEGVACLRVCNGKIAVGSKDGVVRVFSANTGEILHVMHGTYKDYIDRIFIDTELVISAAIPLYITGDDAKHKHIHVWNVEDGALRHIFKIDVEEAILRDVDYRDKMVVGAYSDRCLRLWDAVTGDCLLQPLIYNCEGIAESLSCCLGNGIIALADFDGLKFIIWNRQTGECVTSVSISGDFEDLVDYTLSGKCEAVEDLLVVCLYGHAENYFNVYNHKGELLINLHDEVGMGSVCSHGDKFIIQAQGDSDDFENCIIFKAVSGSSKQMCIVECKGTPEGVDDTKMVVSTFSVLNIYHFW
ncbi:uncharacterized protein [Asterias amurensis]|uniref:uncharacterized protein n=1 Tax=Asterias amurensis TaxID=7602 RepID=UPI003AB85299